MATSTVPPAPDAESATRPDMVPALQETNRLLRAARHALAQSCEDLAAARETALYRTRGNNGGGQ